MIFRNTRAMIVCQRIVNGERSNQICVFKTDHYEPRSSRAFSFICFFRLSGWVIFPERFGILHENSWSISPNFHHQSCAYTAVHLLRFVHSRPQRPRSFWSAPGIETSGRSQYLSVRSVLSLCFSANQICHI